MLAGLRRGNFDQDWGPWYTAHTPGDAPMPILLSYKKKIEGEEGGRRREKSVERNKKGRRERDNQGKTPYMHECFAYMYVCACTCLIPMKARRGIRSSGTGVADGCEPLGTEPWTLVRAAITAATKVELLVRI